MFLKNPTIYINFDNFKINQLKNTINMANLIAILFVLFSFSFGTYITKANTTTTKELSTPRNTIHTHLNNLQSDNYSPKNASKALFKGRYSQKQLETLAVKLKKILDGKKIFINLAKVPSDENYIDTLTGKNLYYISSENGFIYLEKYDNKWLYSEETVSLIDEIYSDIYFIEITNITEGLPSYFHNHFLGLTLWQYIGILIFVFFTYLISKILKYVFKFIFHKILKKLSKFDITIRYLPKLASPFSIGIAIAILDIAFSLLFLPVLWLQKISFIINLIYPVLFILLGWDIADLLGEIFNSITARTKSKLDDQLVPFGRKLVKGIIILLGLFYFVGNLGFDYTPLLAGASIGGLALALAAQETVKNVFGSVTIFVDQPFEVGDYIVFDGVDGVVEEIGLRSTRLRTLYDSVITMPNGKMADMRIDNMGVRTMRRYRTFYNLTYDTPTELIDLYVKGLRELVIQHPNTNKETFQIFLNNLNSHSIDILVNIFFFVETWDEELVAREKFIRDAINLARTIGINFAYPTQTLHINDFPEKQSLNPKYNEPKPTLIKKFNNFLGKKLDE